MAGTIEHYWNGTNLTIISDSGISSCDLKGGKGDTGARGPQGAPGVGEVQSVNGKIGEVVLTNEDVGALPNTYEAPVSSVNGKTGAVSITCEDIGASANTHTHSAATLTESGFVSTGSQEFGGTKTFHGARIKINEGATSGKLTYLSNTGTIIAEAYANQGNATNILSTKFIIKTVSPNSPADGGTTGKAEYYSFPAADAGRTADAFYNVLTTKNTISVLQGGTDATTAEGARINLGITPNDLGYYSLSEVGTEIPSNTDLNDYTTAGNYFVSASSIAETINNTPVNTSGYRLICQNGYGGTMYNFGYQFAFTATGDIYVRTNKKGIWTEWRKYGDIYPVGSIYMSVSNKSPNTLFGGTWESLSNVAIPDTYAWKRIS